MRPKKMNLDGGKFALVDFRKDVLDLNIQVPIADNKAKKIKLESNILATCFRNDVNIRPSLSFHCHVKQALVNRCPVQLGKVQSDRCEARVGG